MCLLVTLSQTTQTNCEKKNVKDAFDNGQMSFFISAPHDGILIVFSQPRRLLGDWRRSLDACCA